MHITQPDYYSDFSCIAGDCPDTCCVGWQVIIDPKHLEYYSSLDGELGETIRKGITVSDGEASFSLCNGRCAMLREDKLCKIQYALGEEALSKVCGFYPRFVTELGLTREQGLSVSCPEVARLLLTRTDPITYITTQTDEPLRYFHDIEPEVMLSVRQRKQKALELIRDRSKSLDTRLLSILDISRDGECPIPVARKGEMEAFYSHLYRLYSSLEQLRPEWGELLNRCKDAKPILNPSDDICWEQLMSYYLFKYSLRSAMDDDFEIKLRRSVLNILLLRDIRRKENIDIIYLVQLFAKETEHNEDNLDAIDKALEALPCFSANSLQSILLWSIS